MPKRRFTANDEAKAYKLREDGETWKAIAADIGCSVSGAQSLYNKHEAKREQKNRKKAKAEGRPTTYTPDLATAVCELIANGKTIEQIAALPDMPSKETVYDWKRDHAEFSDAIARARIEQTHAWAEQIITIADDIQQDILRDGRGDPCYDKSGEPIYIKEQPQRTKLRIETRQWIMERVNRGDFGQRQQLDVRYEYADKDDAEILHELRTAVEAAGLSVDDLAGLLSGAVTIQ